MSAVPPTIYYEDSPSMSRWRNHPQSAAMTAGFFIFLSCGMMMAQGLGWNMNTHVTTTEELQYCWFIAAAVGALSASLLVSFLPKRIFMLVSGALVTTSGILFVSSPYDYDVIISGRCINGFGFGLAAVPYIIHGSEISSRNFRGYVLSMSQVALNMGIMFQICYASQWRITNSFAANTLQGICAITFGVLAIVCTFIIIESPVFYLRKGREVVAQECQRRLIRPNLITTETQAILEEHKAYIRETESYGPLVGLGAFVKVVLFNGVIALGIGIPMNTTVLTAAYSSIGYFYSWPPVVYACMRFLGSCVAMPIIDHLGRKLLSLSSLFVMMAMMFSIGGIFSWGPNLFSTYEMSVVCSLSVVFQFFAGMYAPVSVVYLGEAFPMRMKPFYIALAITIQEVIQVVMITSFTFSAYNAYVFSITAGVIMLVLLIIFIAILPETKYTTLREALHRFSPLLFLRQY